jgi:hypothetical protein
MMAVAGGVTTAYRMWTDDVKLCMHATSTLKDLCDPPDQAIKAIQAGKVATVAMCDVDTVRMAVQKAKVGA